MHRSMIMLKMIRFEKRTVLTFTGKSFLDRKETTPLKILSDCIYT